MTMKSINLPTGGGRPKICVPLVSETEEQLQSELSLVKELPCQMVEWRADFYFDALQPKQAEQTSSTFSKRFSKQEKKRRQERQERICAFLGKIKEDLELPLIFTLRSTEEGGKAELSQEEYHDINRAVVRSGQAEFIDLESGGTSVAAVKNTISIAHGQGVKVILSHHDFHSAPSAKEMLETLIRMEALGSDVSKLAIMPQIPEDVQRLLEAACAMRDYHGKHPFIAIAMGELGLESRICAGRFGSAITFAAGKKATAPGQIDAVTLDHFLQEYYG